MVLIEKYHLMALKEESAMVLYELDMIIILQKDKRFTFIQMIHYYSSISLIYAGTHRQC